MAEQTVEFSKQDKDFMYNKDAALKEIQSDNVLNMIYPFLKNEDISITEDMPENILAAFLMIARQYDILISSVRQQLEEKGATDIPFENLMVIAHTCKDMDYGKMGTIAFETARKRNIQETNEIAKKMGI